MKSCNVIRPELSAYVDGELASRQREWVEAHLASCPRCQQALAELKGLEAGTAALPRLQPAPQFLAQVRAKISGGDDPETLTWFDHLFRPFLLKIPIEVATLIAIALLVIQFVGRVPATIRMSGPPHGAFLPPGQAAATTKPPPPLEGPVMTLTAAAPAENVPSESVTGESQSLAVQAKSAATVSGRNIRFTSGSKRKVPGTNGPAGALILPDVALAAVDVGIDPSTVAAVVVVQSRNPEEVKWRAEELAARYNGTATSVSPPLARTRQIIFVEVPQDNAAAFKLGLQQEPGSSSFFTNAMVAGAAAINTNGALLSATSTARVASVLTSSVGVKPAIMETKSGTNTKDVFNGPAQLSLTNNSQAQVAATAVFAILVEPLPSLAPTNPAPAVTLPGK